VGKGEGLVVQMTIGLACFRTLPSRQDLHGWLLGDVQQQLPVQVVGTPAHEMFARGTLGTTRRGYYHLNVPIETNIRYKIHDYRRAMLG
jgi:hypothetical protein